MASAKEGRCMIALATKFAPSPHTFEAARQAGFRRAELWTDAGLLAHWKDVAPLARRYPFEYAIHFPNQRDLPAEVADHAAALYRALGARALVLHQPQYERHGPALVEQCPDIRLAVENGALTVDQFAAWALHNPGLALDVEHLWKFTLPEASLGRILTEVEAFLTRFAGKLHHVHLPGYLPGQAEHRPMYCSRDLVRGVWDLLERFKFDGLVVSEVAVEFQNIHDLTMDVMLLERWQLERRRAPARVAKNDVCENGAMSG
jgi:hypothetical protein